MILSGLNSHHQVAFAVYTTGETIRLERGRQMTDYVHEVDHAKFLRAIDRALAAEGPVSCELVVWLKRHYVEIRPLYLEDMPVLLLLRGIPDEQLSKKDRELLWLLARDCTTQQIAQVLGKAISTIDARIAVLKRKLGCKTLPGLIAAAMKNRLI